MVGDLGRAVVGDVAHSDPGGGRHVEVDAVETDRVGDEADAAGQPGDERGVESPLTAQHDVGVGERPFVLLEPARHDELDPGVGEQTPLQ